MTACRIAWIIAAGRHRPAKPDPRLLEIREPCCISSRSMSSPPRCVSPLVDEHLEDAVLDAQDRDVERAAAEVVDGDEAGVPLVEAVGERRRRRLVDDAQDLEPGDPPGVARRRALRVVEVGGHGDDRAIDSGSISPCPAKNSSARCFSSRRMKAEISGGVNSRSPRPIRTTPPRSPARSERKQPRLVADVVDALAHEPLHGVHRAGGVDQQPRARASRPTSRPSRSSATDTTDGTSRRRAAIADHHRDAVLHVGDEAVGGAEIDADDFAHDQALQHGHEGHRGQDLTDIRTKLFASRVLRVGFVSLVSTFPRSVLFIPSSRLLM